MRGLLATLSALSAIASVALALTALISGSMPREVGIVLWAATLSIAVIAGTIARKNAMRERAGLARSTIGLMLSFCSLIVGIVAFLM
jgi:uncharacterized membrane protein YecN with MAPEG domain